MNTANQVAALIEKLKAQAISALISMSEACWQTALACIGWSYVYSAWEALCTPAERRKRFKLCPDKTSIKAKCKGFDSGNCDGCQWYPGGERTRCGDCRGFARWIIEQITGFVIYGDTVSTQWNHKDNWLVKGQFGVDPVPQNVLVNVFIKNSSGKWTHTGLYYNGATCECAVGVQYFNPMKKNRWTHWAVAKCFKNGWTMPDPTPKTEPEQTATKLPTLRKGNKNQYVKQAQQLLIERGYNLGICGADGDFGTATYNAVRQFQQDWGLTVDGVIGPKTWEKLTSTPKTPVETRYRVTIKGLTKAQAEELIKNYGGEMTTE